MQHALAILNDAVGAYRPPPRTPVSEYVEGRRHLPPTSDRPGPIDLSLTPWMREILDTFGDPAIKRIVCQKSAQMGWTEGAILNWLYYIMAVAPAGCIAVFPKDQSAKRFVTKKFDPMVASSPGMSGIVRRRTDGVGANTRETRTFHGGFIELVGSNSPANVSDIPAKYAFIEEPDRVATDAGGQGSAIRMAIARTRTFHGAKIFVGGTPTIDGASAIQTEMELSDKRVCSIPCAGCAVHFVPDWEHVVWDTKPGRKHRVFGDHVPESAVLRCPACGHRHDDNSRKAQIAECRWTPTAAFSGRAGFYLPEILSGFAGSTMPSMATDFLEAKAALSLGDQSLMVPFVNLRLGKTFKVQGSGIRDSDLKDRRETYPAPVPFGAAVLTAGVDVQGNRLEVEILGTGENGEDWNIDHRILDGDPYLAPVWKKLEALLFEETWKHQTGATLKVSATCIDTGFATKAAYDFCGWHRFRNVFAVKGVAGEADYWRKQPPKPDRPCSLYTVYGDHFKTDFFFSLSTVKAPGPGYHHFPKERTDVYFEQLASETRRRVFKGGRPVFQWVKNPAQANEALDCRVYASAALMILSPSMAGLRKRLAQQLNPNRQTEQASTGAGLPTYRSRHMARMDTR